MTLTNTGFLSLDQETRAFALVGAFMAHFALLEAGVDDAIHKVLDLRGARALIVTRNMTFNDKIKTLRTLVDFFVLDREVAKRFDRLAKRAKAISENRNIVAHTPFHASQKGDGVSFLVISANSTLKAGNLDWSVDKFLNEIDEINEVDKALREVEKRMSFQRIAEALMRTDKPAEGELGRLFTLGGILSSDPRFDSEDAAHEGD